MARRHGSSRTVLARAVVWCLAAAALFTADTFAAYQYDDHGKRDPFVPLVTTVAQKKRVAFPPLKEVASIDELRLEGVAAGAGGARTAIMNGEIVREKTRVGVLEIVKVADRSVVVVLGGKEYTVKLPQE